MYYMFVCMHMRACGRLWWRAKRQRKRKKQQQHKYGREWLIKVECMHLHTYTEVKTNEKPPPTSSKVNHVNKKWRTQQQQ